MNKPGDWMKTPEFLANAGHFLAGYSFMLTVAFFAHSCCAAWAVMCTAWVAFSALVAVKEYVIDLREESDETVESSTVDAVGYTLGAVVAWGAVLLAHFALGRWP